MKEKNDEYSPLYLAAFDTYLVRKRFIKIGKNDEIEFNLELINQAKGKIELQDVRISLDLSLVRILNQQPLMAVCKVMRQKYPEEPLPEIAMQSEP